MAKKVINSKLRTIFNRRYFSIFILIIFSISVSSELLFSNLGSSSGVNDTPANIDLIVPRLMSSLPLSRNEASYSNSSDIFPVYSSDIESNRLNTTDFCDIEKFDNDFSHISFKTYNMHDVRIDKISPEAMQNDTSFMTFLVNFTIVNSPGWGSNALENITISNQTLNYTITTWGDWTELTNETGYLVGDYSLIFDLNDTILDNLILGFYNLTLTTYVSSQLSNDTIPLPMTYLEVDIENVSPTTFNIAQDTQDFNFTVHLQEIRNMSQNFDNVTGDLPVGTHNPNVTLVSNHTTYAGKSVQLDITGNITSNNNGIYNFTAILPLNDTSATWFDIQNHTMIVSVTSPNGTIASNAWISWFKAVETVLLVNITKISVELNTSIDYPKLSDKEFRLNLNDYINISYMIYDNATKQNHTDPVVITYQDPNDPLNPFALKKVSTSGGNGTLNLTANVLSPPSGVYLLIYVKGYKTSQNSTNTAYIRVYWDKLKYIYTYYDDRGETGTDVTFNQKALGVDINETWEIEVTVLYTSDDSPVKGVHISYSFIGIESGLTDGVTPDVIKDGKIKISYKSVIASTINFSCRIDNVTSINGAFFVDETLYSANFNLSITWTYLKLLMIPSEVDHRLSTGQLTDIDFTANWAHDNSPFNGILRAKDENKGTEKDVFIAAGVGSWQGLVKPFPNLYNYSVLSVVDGPYGITKFTTPAEDEPDERDVQTYIIWDDIYFLFSNDNQTWGDNYFYTPFGENMTLFCSARHFYDDEPFIGTAVLFDLDDTSIHNVTFYDGLGIWTGNRSDAYRAVDFQFSGIIEDVQYGVTQIHGTPTVTIIWDIILVILTTENRTYLHGSYANISVTLKYRFSDNYCDPTQVKYDLHLSNETSSRTNVTLTHFLDFSIKPDVHWYYITGIFDNITGLTAFEVEYEWLDQDMANPEKGDLAVYWIDNEDPSILEIYTKEIGNGTILIIVDATDDSETWEGSGISDITLIDNRYEPGIAFPLPADEYSLSNGIYRYIFKFNYDQTVSGWEDTFSYEFDEVLSFTLFVTDTGTPTYPDNLGTRTASSGLFSITANYDPFSPQFIAVDEIEMNITYLTIDSSYNLTAINDGDIIITVFVQDYGWSGLNESSVKLTVIDQEEIILVADTMELQGGELGERSREMLKFTWNGNLPVFETYKIIVTITDIAGNINSRISEITIEDNVAPRITDVELGITIDRKLEVIVTLEEAGVGVDYVIVEVIEGGFSQFYNLSIQGGGNGASVANGPQTLNYSAIVPLEFSLFDFISSKTYSIKITVSDRIGNQKNYNTDDLERLNVKNIVTLLPIPLQYLEISLLVSAILLISAIIVGIKIFSKTEGYDMKKIITESEKISRETILTQMDEYALGVTVNFFDQVQGPVPVIWEPPLLEDQEQVMLDLSDKSFSTLEFIGSEETERSGIFDFSTGSYECTALGYSFAVVNPDARGGKENLTIVLLLRKEWGNNLLIFQDELVEKLRDIREMIEGQNNPSQIEKKSRELREFVSRLMISFNKLYTGTKYESDYVVE